jgi:serine/threonine protein kinase
MAPEVFHFQTGFKSDVWSAGIILYEMTYGRSPYFSLGDQERKAAAISSMTPISFPRLSNPYLHDCLKQCLRFDSRLRPSAYELLAHPFTRM